jgi:hypothetical protein
MKKIQLLITKIITIQERVCHTIQNIMIKPIIGIINEYVSL